MGIIRFCIIFDKLDKVYYPGEKVTGRVQLELNSEKEIKGIELKLKGKAECKWTENNGKFIHHFKEKEIYIKSKQILIGGKNTFKLSSGKHIYPFSATLPLKAPSSFSSSRGKIIYYAEAKIDGPLGFDKHERSEFTVQSPIDLNLYPHLRTSHKTEKVKRFQYLCCASGRPLTITVELAKTAFAASECIPITIEIHNTSNVTISMLELYLKRKTVWKAEGSKKKEYATLQKLRSSGLEVGQFLEWTENFTIISSIAFPFLDCCSLIKINHELHIIAITPDMHTNLNVHIPITIGDILLNEIIGK